MMCFSPIRIKTDQGNLRDVPCGRCVPCMKRRRDSWTFRLKQELKYSSSAHFITLTYSDDNLPRSPAGFPIVSKRDVQLFMKRFRKLINPIKVRYFLVSEYGTQTFRPHYHIIMFGFPSHLDISPNLSEAWKLGHHHVGSVTDASIHYCTKYVLTQSDLPEYLTVKDYACFMLCSKRPALGSQYLTPAMVSWHKSSLRSYVQNGQFKQSIPRYYKEKIFSREELFQLRVKAISSSRLASRKYLDSYASYDDTHYISMCTQQKLDLLRRERLKNKNNRLKI